MRKNSAVSAYLLSVSAVALFASIGIANAQEAVVSSDAAANAPKTETDSKEEATTVVVTGSHISGVKPVGSKIVSVTREEILASGLSQPSDVVRKLPQSSDLGNFKEAGYSFNNNNGQQATAINLRGLGNSSTLTLIDGRRTVVSGSGVAFTDANQIPLAAMERVEISNDGASAIYGSDAVGGVVNYITRKNYKGVEVSVRTGNSQGGYEVTPSLTVGNNWEWGNLGHGNLVFSYEYMHRDRRKANASPYYMQNLTSLGGPDRRISFNNAAPTNAGNIVVQNPGSAQNPTIPTAGNYTYYGLPQGANTGLTASQLLLNQPNIIDRADYNDYIAERKQHQFVVLFNQDIGSRLNLYGEVWYSHKNTDIGTLNSIIQNVTLAPYLYNSAGQVTTTPNPYYISGIPNVTPGSRLNVQYNAMKDVGNSPFITYSNTYSITGGGTLKLGKGWKGEAFYSFARDEACNGCQAVQVNGSALQRQIDLGNVNPLSSNPVPAAIAGLYTASNTAVSGNGGDQAVLKFDGPLFRLPAGVVKAAVGAEYDRIFNWNYNRSAHDASNVIINDTTRESTYSERSINALFAELYVPVVSSEMNIPLVQDLTFDVAVRKDSYSDVGDTTNPRIGATWTVNDHLRLRGTYGTSFRAPSLVDTNPNAISFASNGTVTNNSDPRITNRVDPVLKIAKYAILYDANPDIKPETAKTYSVGGDLFFFDNRLKLSASYYKINYTNRIARPNAQGAFNAGGQPDYGGYGKFIIPLHNTASCSNSDPSTADPALQKYLNLPILYDYGFRPDFCSLDLIFDVRNTNLATTRQDGIDAGFAYTQTIKDIDWTVTGAVTHVLHNDVQVGPGAPFTSQLGTYDTMLEWKGRGSISAHWRSLDTSLFMNYTGSFINNYAVNNLGQNITPYRVDPWITYDLNVSYWLPVRDAASDYVKTLRASVTFQNVFDTDPHYALVGSSSFNQNYSNAFGRTFSFQLTAGF